MMHLSKAIPEEKGISSAKIEQFLRRAGEKTGIHSAMIYKSAVSYTHLDVYKRQIYT